MYPNRKRKLTRITLGFTLFLIIFDLFIPFSYATEWFSIPDTRLTWGNTIDYAPSITQAQDGRIWIVWHSFEIGVTNPDIYYKIYNESSTFQWSSHNKLTTNLSNDITPSITTAGNDIWVVWSSNRDGNYEIYYKIYNGLSWTPDTRLITNPNSDWDPSITQAQDGKIWVAWTRDDDVYYKVLQATRIGEDLQIDEVVPDTNITKPDETIDWHPSIMQTQNNETRIVWDSLILERDVDIYCKIYSGSFWSEERITYNNKDDVMPAIMQASDGAIWITWTSDRVDNWDIYYKTDPPFQDLHDIAIISVTYDPDRTVAFQGLTFSILVVPQNYGMVGENVEVTSYANSTPIGSQMVHISAGQLKSINFLWDTTTVNPGNYVISAEASIVLGENDTADNTLFNGMIQVRIPGDADFNGIVELTDFVLWVNNFGKTAEELSLNAYADFDNNGLVELSDFPVWVNNIGREYG